MLPRTPQDSFQSRLFLLPIHLFVSVSVTEIAAMKTAGGAYHGGHHQLFLDAVRCGDARRLRHLLDPDAGPPSTSSGSRLAAFQPVNIDVFSADGQTALHQCCRVGNLELVKLLVSYGADVRLATRDGWTALHIAVGAGHVDVVRFLLKACRH